MNEEERKLIGHDFTSFFKDCTFRGKNCLEEKYVGFYVIIMLNLLVKSKYLFCTIYSFTLFSFCSIISNQGILWKLMSHVTEIVSSLTQNTT